MSSQPETYGMQQEIMIYIKSIFNVESIFKELGSL